MKPISAKFLKSSGTYKAVTGKDSWGNPTYSDTTITRVYVEAPKRNSLTDLGEQTADRLVLFHDVRRSRPADQVYTKGDSFTYNGETYLIRDAQLLPNPDQPHLWEVRLT